MAQGLGEALYERIAPDAGPQCLSTSLMDYIAPQLGRNLRDRPMSHLAELEATWSRTCLPYRVS